MNADELEVLLTNAVKSYCQEDTIRASEDVEEAGLRQSSVIRDYLDQLRRFVTHSDYHESCLKHAAALSDAGFHRAAIHTCLASYWASRQELDVAIRKEQEHAKGDGKLATASGAATATIQENLGDLVHRCRGEMLTAYCKFHLLIEGDAHMENPLTLHAAVDELKAITVAMKTLFPHSEELYHWIYNGTILLFQCSEILTSRRFFRQAAVFLGWAARTCDTVIKLATTRYLRWRVRLYSCLSMCYDNLGDFVGAQTIAQHLLQRVEELHELEHMDVVPPTPEQVAELVWARRRAKVLILRAGWKAGDAEESRAETPVAAAGKGKAKVKVESSASDNMPGLPSNPVDVIDRVNGIVGTVAGELEQAQAIIEILLLLASDDTHRSHTDSKSKTATVAAQALNTFTMTLVDNFLKKHNVYTGADDVESTISSQQPAAKAASKGKAAAKGKAKEEDTSVSLHQMSLGLDEVCSVETILQITVILKDHGILLSFDKFETVVEKLQDVNETTDSQRAQFGLIVAMRRVIRGSSLASSIKDAANALQVCMNVRINTKNPAFVEDAALSLLRDWESIPNSHEHPDAGTVLALCTTVLIRVGHNDVLRTGNTAVTAVRCLKRAREFRRATFIASQAYDYLSRRQFEFVSSHSTEKYDTTQEVLSQGHLLTTSGGMWLSTVCDLRTVLVELLCELRLQLAVMEEHAALKSQHEGELQVLNLRKENTHLYGNMTLKEQRTLHTTEAAVVDEPKSVRSMELKLLAWAADSPIKKAITLMQIAIRQKTQEGVRKFLLESCTVLDESHEALDAETTGVADHSLYYGWSALATRCHETKVLDPLPTIERRVVSKFVQKGVEHALWNKSPATWDALNDAAVRSSSAVLLEGVGVALQAIALYRMGLCPDVPDNKLHDDSEQGLDSRRYLMRETQLNHFRCANLLMMSVEVSVNSTNEGLILRGCNALYNALFPLVKSGQKTPIVLRPMLQILNALGFLTERRWSDTSLQLLAARTLKGAFDATGMLPERSQKPVYEVLTQAMLNIWKQVHANPNARQQRHLQNVRRNLAAVASTIKIEPPKEPEVASDPKAKGKGKDKGQAAAAQQEGPTTIYARQDPFTSDSMPLEYFELAECVILQHPKVLKLLEGKSEAELAPAFPIALVAIAVANQQSPQAAMAKLSELKSDPEYPKYASILAKELLKKRSWDTAQAVCNDGITEVDERWSAVMAVEREGLKAFYLNWIAAQQQKEQERSQDSAPLTNKEKATHMLSRKIGEIRKRLAYRKLRTLHMQYGVPFKAQLKLLLASALHAALPPMDPNAGPERPPSTPPVLGSQKPAKGAKPGKGKSEVKEEPTKEIPQAEVVLQQQAAVLKTFVSSMILFNRCLMPQHSYAAMLHAINSARSMLGDVPPTVLVDVLRHVDPNKTPTASATPASFGSTPAQQQQQAPAVKADGFLKVEGIMRVLASAIIQIVEKIQSGTFSPHQELEFRQPSGVKLGRDVLDGGLLRRTTSLNLHLSQDGAAAQRLIDESEQGFAKRLIKVFQRERNDFEESELWDRRAIEKSWLEGAYALAGIEFVDDDDFSTALPTRREMAAKAQAEAEEGIEDQRVEHFEIEVFGKLRIEAILRCFMYAVNCMQYGKKKRSAMQLCLDMNNATGGSRAVEILPYAINLLNAVGANIEPTMKIYRLAVREQPRAQKLISAAKKSWAQYRETETFRRALNRLAGSLQPTLKKVLDPQSPQPDADTVSVSHRSAVTGITAMTGITAGAVGPSGYREVVAAYNAAIEYLRQKHSTIWLVNTLFELGTIHLVHRVKAEAERSWGDAVDATVGRVNSVAKWKTVIAQLGDDLVKKCGLWRILVSVASLANIAQYCCVEDQAKATECCLFASELLWQVSRQSLGGPQREWDAGNRELSELLPGVFAEEDSTVLPGLAHAMLHVAHHLKESGHPLQCITVCNSLELIARRFVRSVNLVVQSRIIRAQACAMCGNFTSAISSLSVAVRGRALPHQTLGALGVEVDIVERGERQGTASGQTRGAKDKGKKEEPKKVVSDDAEMPEYDNNKPPSAPGNVQAVEALIALMNQQTWSLVENVTQEYGPALSRRVVIAVVDVLLALAAVDSGSTWSAASEFGAEQQQVAKSGKSDAKKPAQNASPSASRDASGSAVALAAAESLLANLVRVRPKTPGTDGAGKNPRATTPNKSERGEPIPPRAPLAAAEELFVNQKSQLLEARLYRVKGAFTKSTEVLEKMLTQLGNSERQVLSLSDVPSFTYAIDGRMVISAYYELAKSMVASNRWVAATEAISAAMQIAELCNDSHLMRDLRMLLLVVKLRTGEVLVAQDIADAVVDESKVLSWRGVDPHEAAGFLAKRLLEEDSLVNPSLKSLKVLHGLYTAPGQRQEYAEVVQQLHQRANQRGMNVELDSWWAATFQRHNTSVRDLHLAMNSMAPMLLRQGELDHVVRTMEACLAIAEHDLDYRCHQSIRSKLFLVRALRQSTFGTRPTIVSAPTAVDESLPETLEFTDATQQRLKDILEEIIRDSVTRGVHDYETLRQALCEAFVLCAASSSSAPSRITAFSALQAAEQITTMRNAIFENTTSFGDAPLTNVEELPHVLVSEIEELARRELNPQTEFTSQFGTKTVSKVPISSTTMLQYFAELQRRLSRAFPAEADSLEEKLIRVRGYLQDKVIASPTPILQGPAPLWDAATVAKFLKPTPSKVGGVTTQSMVLNTCGAPEKIVDGVSRPTYPYVALLIGAQPVEKDGLESKEPVDAKQAKAKGGKTAEAVEEAPQAKTVPSCAVVLVEQQRLIQLRKSARRLATLMSGSTEVNTIDDAVGNMTDAKQSGKGGKGGKDAKDAKEYDAPTPAPAHVVEEIDLLKEDVLLGFLELVATEKFGGQPTEKTLRPLYPAFTLQQQHVEFIASVLDANGGSSSSDPAVVTWFTSIIDFNNNVVE